MDLRIVNEDDVSIEVEFVGESETLMNLLKAKLLEDKKTESATFLQEHPLLGNPHLALHVKDGKPGAVLRAAAKALKADLDELDDLVLKAKAQ